MEPPDSLLTFMLLTQVATLYLGQRRGFFHAHHLGGIIVSQARRFNLFNELDHPIWRHQITIDSQFDQFIRLETLKRIVERIFVIPAILRYSVGNSGRLGERLGDTKSV
jgi:hypothetical protein